ncbi:hypothetical protein ABPG74_006174 [Tetrahymena malaccensis]
MHLKIKQKKKKKFRMCKEQLASFSQFCLEILLIKIFDINQIRIPRFAILCNIYYIYMYYLQKLGALNQNAKHSREKEDMCKEREEDRLLSGCTGNKIQQWIANLMKKKIINQSYQYSTRITSIHIYIHTGKAAGKQESRYIKQKGCKKENTKKICTYNEACNMMKIIINQLI